MPRADKVAGILLAAGASRRMGRNKLLIEVEGEALVRRAARRALEVGLAPLLVVVRPESEGVRAALAGLPCHFVLNALPGDDPAGSLHCALRALPREADSLVVLLPDMIRVSAEMIGALLLPQAPLVVSRYDGVIAPPMRFQRTLIPELLSGSGRTVVRDHLEAAHFIDWPAAALLDLDRPGDIP